MCGSKTVNETGPNRMDRVTAGGLVRGQQGVGVVTLGRGIGRALVAVVVVVAAGQALLQIHQHHFGRFVDLVGAREFDTSGV